jgi:hypothetical protein
MRLRNFILAMLLVVANFLMLSCDGDKGSTTNDYRKMSGSYNLNIVYKVVKAKEATETPEGEDEGSLKTRAVEVETVTVTEDENVGTVGLSPMPVDKKGYPYKQEVSLVPVPKKGYRFWGWGGTNKDEIAGNKIVMTHMMDVEAIFIKDAELEITIHPAPDAGYIAVSPDPNENGNYDVGQVVRLSPVPSEGYAFVGFDGADAEEIKMENGKYTFNSDGNKKLITAKFERLNRMHVVVEPANGGTVTATVNGAAVNLNDYFKRSDTVTLAAVPAVGFRFLGWKFVDTGNTEAQTWDKSDPTGQD